MRDFIYENKIWLGIILSLILISLGLSITFVYLYQNKDVSCDAQVESLEFAVEEDIEVTEEVELNYVYIDVKGAVKNPGVYKLAQGSIINEAVSTAGGFLSTAITSNINLSKVVTNEMVLYVFSKSDYETVNVCDVEVLTEEGEENSSVKSDEIYIEDEINLNESIIENSDVTESTTSNLVNLNTASIDELMTLSGIGESKAEAIISYREDNGLFSTIEDLLNVSGIGDSTYDAIKDSITV